MKKQELGDLLGDTILKPKDVAEAIGLSQSSVYRLARTDPDFPNLVPISHSRSGFWASEIKRWLADKKDA